MGQREGESEKGECGGARENKRERARARRRGKEGEGKSMIVWLL